MTHPKKPKRERHGGTGTKLYDVWRVLKDRCLNERSKDYKYYGGKGIQVCDEWYSFSKFREWSLKSGFKDGMCIDRIDSNNDYKPVNCRWVTRSESTLFKFGRDMRKTCKNGHLWNKQKPYRDPRDNSKRCSICSRVRSSSAYLESKKEKK